MTNVKGKPNPRRDPSIRRLRTKTEQAIRSRVLAGEPCALCGQPIDLSLPQTYIDPRDGKRKRAPWSLEVDEIVPVSRGGACWGSNCQPAHRICNQKAGDKRNMMQQRRLEMVKKPKPSKDW